MNNDICFSVVSSLFKYFSKRFINLPVLDELKVILKENQLKAFLIDVYAGRDMTLIAFTGASLHRPVIIKRLPVDHKHGLDEAFHTAVKDLIIAAVTTIKTLPSSMLYRTYFLNGHVSDWETADKDILGVVISAGLLTRHATFSFGGNEFSVFYDSDEIKGHHFKSPTYVNNVFYLSSKVPHGPDSV